MYHIGPVLNGDTAVSWCNVPLSDPLSPLDCYNANGGQLRSYNGTHWLDDTTAVIFKCNNTQGMEIQTTSTSESIIFSDWFGRMGNVTLHYHLNQSEITGISSWALFTNSTYTFYNAIGKFSWVSEALSVTMGDVDSGVLVPNSSWNNCVPFLLNTGDYINGYRLVYGHDYIFGLVFYSFKNNRYTSFECFANGGIQTGHFDSGVVYYPNHYLSGLIFDAGWVIEGMKFQFTRNTVDLSGCM